MTLRFNYHQATVLLRAPTCFRESWREGLGRAGKLGKDGQVFYHVLIADETSGGATHVWVNAIDGTILRTNTELPRKQRSPENQ